MAGEASTIEVLVKGYRTKDQGQGVACLMAWVTKIAVVIRLYRPFRHYRPNVLLKMSWTVAVAERRMARGADGRVLPVLTRADGQSFVLKAEEVGPSVHPLAVYRTNWAVGQAAV